MVTNDPLYLIFEPHDGEPDAVEYQRFNALIETIREAVSVTARHMMVQQRELHSLDQQLPTAQVYLTTPQRGSCIFPIFFDLPEILEVLKLPASSIHVPSRAILDWLADLNTVTDFLTGARDLLFGDGGVLPLILGRAKRSTDDGDEVAPTREQLAIAEFAPILSEQIRPTIEHLMFAARRTGHKRVTIKIRDFSVDLVGGEYTGATWRMAARANGMPREKIAAGVDVVRTGPAVPVDVNGERLTAFPVSVAGDRTSGPVMVMLWPDEKPVPPDGQRMSVRGSAIEVEDLSPQGELPDDWPSGLRGAMRAKEWQYYSGWQS